MDAETYRFEDDGRFPNSALPLLVRRAALPHDAAAIERVFARNGWSNAWRDGVFGFHHFHSVAHEALGVARGAARVMFGGPGGRALDLRAGDAVVIPAGVAHRALEAGADFLVVGAYPGGADFDVRRGDAAEHAAALRAIAAVPLPRGDPAQGAAAPPWR